MLLRMFQKKNILRRKWSSHSQNLSWDSEHRFPQVMKKAVAERLMCAVLGGTASSKLFNNVREKQSLCYYCSSSYDSIKGIMYINSGVEGENLEKAEKAILKEIEDMKNGEITDFEIEATKLAVVNSFKSSSDSVSGIENWYTGESLTATLKLLKKFPLRLMPLQKSRL